MSDWFARPVLFVTDVARSIDFYVNQLGFVGGGTTLSFTPLEDPPPPRVPHLERPGSLARTVLA
jgi:catechol 2,3-dioxygenase-like lactoylglutathione lyase family enzyme